MFIYSGYFKNVQINLYGINHSRKVKNEVDFIRMILCLLIINVGTSES